MSVQLILYPQSYDGQFNAMSSSPTEVVVNGINFLNLNSTSTYTSVAANPYTDSLTNAPPSSINTWYRFRKGTIAYPTAVLGNILLVGGSSEISGVYQKLSNLTIGGQYTITINIDAAVVGGNVKVGVYSGSTLQTSTTYSSNTTQISSTFIAGATELTIMISYSNASASDLTISDISTQPVIGAVPSGSSSILDNGQVICDLYEDEDIPLTLSVDNFKNVAEKVQSYSKAFNLPATKRNNKIFDQIFEITRSDDGVIFNVYKKTQCVLKQDGFTLFQGFLRLLDVTDKKGEISYNVNLYSEVIALADFLKELAFRDLDFSELDHSYNYTNIRQSWQGNLPLLNPLSTDSFAYSAALGVNNTNVLKYPFVDWNHQYIVGGSGNPVLPNLESSFRPFISVKYIINRIFESSPFTYTSDFFSTTAAAGGFDFDRLYMDFNWGADNTPILASGESSGGQGALTSLTTAFSNMGLQNAGATTLPANWSSASNQLTSTLANESYSIDYVFSYYGLAGDTQTRQWVHKDNTGAIIEIFNYSTSTLIGTTTSYIGNFSVLMQPFETLQLEVKTTDLTGTSYQYAGSGFLTFAQYFINTTSNSILQTLRGETGQWDFLKGLITMFNLVTLVDEDNPNNIIIETYSDVFINSSTSVQLDWTDKIDVSEMKLTPLTDLNIRTIFKFVEDDDDYAFTQYKNLVGGHLYGSKKYNAGNEFNILDGEDEIVAEPFAATVIKPLMSQYADFIVPSIYSYNSNDDTSEGFDNSPRIMYSNGVKTLSSDTYYVPAQNGGAGDAFEDEFLQFSHLSAIPTVTTSPPAITDTVDFHFGECQLMLGVGAATAYNLFNMYWLPYYAELYNPNTRSMTIKVNLTPADINTFKFNDTVFIKNREFRVNKIDYKPNDLAKVEFILIP